MADKEKKTVDDEEIKLPDIENLPDGVEFPFKPKFHKPKFRFVSKRDIPLIIIVILLIAAATCPKPYSNDLFFCWRPAFWSVDKLQSGESYMISIPSADSSDSSEEDRMVITDITDQISEYPTPEDYIHYRVSFEMEYATMTSEVSTTSQLDISEISYIKTSTGLEGYYFIFTPGGEYSGNKTFNAVLSDGEKMISVSFRSRWTKFDSNYSNAFKLINTMSLK